MRIYPIYDEIIIAITTYTYGGKKKQVIPPQKSKEILERTFQHLPKIRVEIVGKAMMVRERFDDLPRFDVVVSGNLETIRKMEQVGIKARYVPRTKGLSGWSGKELREALNWS